MPSERVIWGPPGTGKTTAGIALARDWYEAGTAPSQIAYLAFTKAAATEAAVRIFESEDDTKLADQFPLFRTIHSLCYRGLRRDRPDLRLINTADMKQFARVSGMDGSYAVFDWEDLAEVYRKLEDRGRTEWDAALAAYDLSRITARSVDDLERSKTVPNREAERLLGLVNMKCDVYGAFVARYERFKKADGLIDFTDMLDYGLREMPPIGDCRHVITDEAQDLCPLHYAILDRLFGDAEEMFWIGDDDQALYKFSGASAELFLERAARADFQMQLRQTHRFGQNIVDFSGKIIRRVSRRHPKEIIGVSGKEGLVGLSGEFKPVHGDFLILHRHVKGCQALGQAYIFAGLPFRNERGKDPLGSPVRLKAWKALDTLADGGTVAATQASLLVEELMPSVSRGEHDEKVRLVVHGAKSKLEDLPKGGMDLKDLVRAKVLTEEGVNVLRQREYWTLRHSADLEYYDRVVKNGYELDPQGKIAHIVTIHGSKGRQAGGAVVFNEMGMRCWEDPDTEHRLAYVASTRTKTDLTICAESQVDWARSQYNYPVEEGGNGQNGGPGDGDPGRRGGCDTT